MLIKMEIVMKWSAPLIEEICVGMEINMYFPAEL
ncbi:MAG: pyrroloquinoline quinone precursor peptide PqqA [Pseudomonadota bacterium]